jgi:hypothetical protein
MPIGMPGWPEFACCTASMASARNTLASSRGELIRGSLKENAGENPDYLKNPLS